MSDNIIFEPGNGVVPEYETKKREKKAVKSRRFFLLKILVCLLTIVLAVELVLYTIILPCTVPVHVQFEGLNLLTVREISAIEPFNGPVSWLRFNTAAASNALAVHPLVESVSVEKIFPDRAVVTVTERKPAAVALFTDGEKTVPVQIDKNGVVFRINEGLPAGSIPVISGLTFEKPKVGMRLHAKLRPLMERLAEIQARNPAYFSLISEIRIEAKDYGNYDLIIYPMRSRTRLQVDRGLRDETLKYMMVVLDVLDTLKSPVDEIDLRYGSISFKTADGGML